MAWKVATLAEVTEVVSGGTSKSGVSEYWGGDVEWITPKDMGKRNEIYASATDRKISHAGLERSSAKLVPPHSVILSTRAPIGHLVINTVPMAFNQGCRGLIPKSSIDAKYLYYFLSANVETLNELGTGTTFKELSKKALESVSLPVPPLPEQKRIVALLDQAFADIDKARALTEQNLKNARELLESTLQQVFSQCGEGWVKTTLGQATGGVLTGPFGSLLHKRDYVENGIPLINPAHITDTGIEPDQKKTVSHATKERLANYVMTTGDIVIGRRGEMGRCAEITEQENGYLCGTGSFFIKASDRVDSSYLTRYLRSDGCRHRLEKIAGGAVMPNLSNSELSKLSIFLPPIRKQQEISQQIDDLARRTDQVRRVYQDKIAALDELKKSLLQKAFSGELTQGHAEAAA